MRPRELRLRGFRSHADETSFDFSGRGLVGIVGPIGSGKSSILDAVAFALFGKTPRVEAGTKSLINQRKDSLQVELTFEVEGAGYRAVRALRRGGASQHALYRLTDEGDDLMADKAREMGLAVEALLGMDFDAFRRSVLLAQNQFAAFLEATPTDRNVVLKGVFGFDRLDTMRSITKSRLDRIEASLGALAARRASADADRAELETKRTAWEKAAERAEALEKLRDSVAQADDVLKEAEATVEAQQVELKRLDEVIAAVPSGEEAEAAVAAASGAAAQLAAADAELESAGAAAEKAVAAVAAMEEDIGGREKLQTAGEMLVQLDAARTARQREEQQLSAHREKAEQAASRALESQQARAATSTRESEAKTGLAQARAALKLAEDELHGVHSTNSAALLRGELDAGTLCPVCEQVVEHVPDAIEAADLADAERDHEAAREAERKAQEDHADAVAAEAAASAALRAAEEAATEAEERVAAAEAATEKAGGEITGHLDRLAELIGEGDPADILDALRTDLAGADAAVAEARKGEAAARDALERVRAESRAAEESIERLGRSVAAVAGRLEIEVDIEKDAESVGAALARVRDECVERRVAITERIEERLRAVEAARAARTDLLEKADLPASVDIVEVTTEAGREATALGAQIEVLEKRAAEREELEAQEADALKQSELVSRLHGDLAPSRFLEFVLDERRRLLSDLAGVHLETLTAGRYRFSDDGDFDLMDLTAADAVRSPASLSGGETFLASLALALALAEMVAREGGRLDSFFLDEGFGSLDAEHLDLAMDGIERLVATGDDRLVVIVSHVPTLRDRIEDLIVLDRDEHAPFRRARGRVELDRPRALCRNAAGRSGSGGAADRPARRHR